VFAINVAVTFSFVVNVKLEIPFFARFINRAEIVECLFNVG
jgi:hypothetical protein